MGETLNLALQKHNIAPEILARYPFRVKRLEPVKAVYRLETDIGPKMLKRSSVSESKLRYVYEAMNYLFNQGFKQVPPFIPTSDGLPYVTHGNDFYFVSDWVRGRESDFRSRSDLELVAVTLAEFHKTARGLNLAKGAKAKLMWGKWPKTFQSRCQDLLQFQKAAEEKRDQSAFDRFYLTNVDYFYSMGLQALEILSHSQYHELVEQAINEKTFCHRDVAGRNFIITPDRQCFLIDFDYSRFDIRLTDLVRLLERTLKKNHWDINAAKNILNIYNSFNPLDKREYPVLLAFMYFPQKFWRISDRYYTMSKDWSEKKYLSKMKLLLEQKMAKEIFLQRFSESFCT